MMISLSGISKRGKQLVRQYGSGWRVLTKRDRVLFSQKIGNWLLVVPGDRPESDEASRWINSLDDENFKVMPYA